MREIPRGGACGSPTQSERMWTGTWWGAGAMKREKSTVGERVRGEKGGE